MKIGYFRKDDSLHEYIITEDEIKRFDEIMFDLEQNIVEDDYYDLCDEIDEKFGKYRVEGELYSKKIILED